DDVVDVGHEPSYPGAAFLPEQRARERHMTAIGIYGSLGRMGQAIAAELSGMGARHAGGADATDDAAIVAQAADVLVDFSSPNALEAHLAAARGAGTPIVIGTTGLSERHHAAIDDAAREIA